MTHIRPHLRLELRSLNPFRYITTAVTPQTLRIIDQVVIYY